MGAMEQACLASAAVGIMVRVVRPTAVGATEPAMAALKASVEASKVEAASWAVVAARAAAAARVVVLSVGSWAMAASAVRLERRRSSRR